MGFIDADSHVLETPDTWSFLDPSEEHFRPQILEFEPGSVIRLGARAKNTAMARTPSKVWTAGDTWTRYMPPHGALSPHVNLFEPGMLDLTDPAKRIEALDALGIDVQVLFSTFYIGTELDNPLEEAALTRSYNRWVGESLKGHTDRLKWVLRPPLRMMDRALAELEYGAEHGAVGIHLRGQEHGYYLCDPYFFPLFEKAQELDLTILVHNGATVRRTGGIPIGNFVPQPPALMTQLAGLMFGFYAVLGSDISQRFPRLRWGFIEGGATFTLPIMQQHARRDMSIGVQPFLDPVHVTPEELERMNIFIALETDEDIPYLAQQLGENTMIVGTDFGHNDLGSELGAHQTVLAKPGLDPVVARKIVDDNGRKLFNIDPNFRPASAAPRSMDIPHIQAVGGGPAHVVPSWVKERSVEQLQRV
jgi:predicted TIM-barrel fold metal-dependent hydrolase